MGVTPSNLGKYADVNLIGLNTNLTSSSSSKNEAINAGINTALGIGTLLLGGMISGKRAATEVETTMTPEQQQQQVQNQLIANLCEKYDLQGMDSEIAKIDTEVADLDIQIAKENDNKNIENTEEYKNNEKAIEDAETKYGFGSGDVKGQTAEQGRAYQRAKESQARLQAQFDQEVSQIANYETNIGKDGQGGGLLDQKISQLDGDIKAKEDELSKYEENPADEQTKNEKYILQQDINNFKTQKTQLENQRREEQSKLKQLKAKNKETETALKALTDQANDILNTGTSDEIKQAYTDYQSLLATRDSLKGKKVGADTKIAELTDKRATLLANKTLLQSAKSLEIQNTKNGSKINAAGEDYTAADQKDGNWLSRTWQKTKGIFSKSARAEYKLMKQAHEQKNAAGDKLEALGADPSQFSQKSVQKAERQETAEQKTRNLINSFSTNPTATRALNSLSNKITAYFMSNPDKTIEDAMKEFGIQENGEPKPETQ